MVAPVPVTMPVVKLMLILMPKGFATVPVGTSRLRFALCAGHTDEQIDRALEAIREVTAGKRYLSPTLAERAINGYLEKPGESELDIYDTLTNRERLVLQLAAEGNTSGEIATRLFISPRTAETHRANQSA